MAAFLLIGEKVPETNFEKKKVENNQFYNAWTECMGIIDPDIGFRPSRK